ncbi:YihY/virulence factor BrkB family protein [Isoptericola sp. b408]|uniref:YihY/virulence factor BrkB family protein n=1 Tax=Isoptericola sp. b408 TaxID=3064653 RepID=UPI0027135B4F|nr:YihY/virulence factor BrkB family protein [Isoptericola sp. b408]MDO8151666.1 YihY/virulence factor BrkB family protein [Isoptericola sp. b408]
MSERLDRWKDRATRLVGWVKDRREVRALQWYMARRGNLLSGGIAYTALFALGAGLTIGFSVFSRTLGSNDELMAQVTDEIELWLPGLIGDGENQLDPADLVVQDLWNVTTLVAAVVLLWTAISFMGALRHSIRTMFDAPVVGVNPVLAKVWQLAGFVLLGSMIVVTAAASIVTTQVEDWLGDSGALGALLSAGSLAVALVLDAVIVFLMVRVLSRVRPRRARDLVIGCLVAAAVSGALRSAGTSLVTSSVSSNILLGSFVTLGTILLLANVLSRVLLMICAWMHDPPRMDEVVRAEEEVEAMRHAEEIERMARQGAGHGKPYSPVVRGVRRARYTP